MCLPRPKYKKELASIIEERIAPWLTEEQKKYIHPCGTSDPFLGLFLPTFAVSCSYDNLFQGALPDAYKAYQKWLTGAMAVGICVSYMIVKIYEFPGPSPVQTLKSSIKFPICPANFRIYRDTAIVVIISYVLLLDINLSYLWLAIFPLIAISFIFALFVELCHPGDNHGKEAVKSGSSSIGASEPNDDGKIRKEPEELEFIVMMPFCALCALCVLAQLDDHAAERFVVSQFLLFLSSTLGVLTRMMMRLPAGASPDVTPASELVHKTFLLLLLVTVHTVAAELLGEDMVLVCMPEIVPVLLWFSVHLDRDSSIISVKKIKWHKNVFIAFTALLACLATYMDETGLSHCTTIMVSCAVSGLLTYYLVFMLHQWPRQQAAGNNDMAAHTSLQATCLQSEKQGGKDKDTTASLEVAVQSEEQAGLSEEAAQLLKFWANALLMAAAALLLLKFVVALRLWPEEPLVNTLRQIFRLW